MALLQISCEGCGHVYYRIVVACNSDGVDMTCPACDAKEGQIHVMKTKDGTTPFAACKHVPETSGESSATSTHHEHAPEDQAS